MKNRILPLLLIFAALLNGRLVFAAPDAAVAVQSSPGTQTYHMILPSSQSNSESVSIIQRKLSEKRAPKAGGLQPPPDYRFKPVMQPYTVGETFSISTPLHFVSF